MAYNEFAYFYDEFNGEADYDALYRAVKMQLDAHGIRDGIVADLGCGTGELTLMLAQAGYDMIGVDQSEEMLCVVRDKADQLAMAVEDGEAATEGAAPEAGSEDEAAQHRRLSSGLLLLQQDILKLDLYGTIRAAVSTFDTFNHIPDLDTAIKNAAFFMEEGGVFLFDMNTPYKHREILADNVFCIEGPDAVCNWQNHYDAEHRRVNIAVDIHYEDTGEDFREEFCEYTYTLAEIKASLEKHGFVLESVCDGESFGPLRSDSPRYFFCAVKKYTQLGEN